MVNFIYSLMTDRRNEAYFAPFKFLLYIVSLVYGLAIFSRSLLYRFGIFKKHKAPLRIVSVGNLTLGGTGKTPFVMTLARILNDELKKSTSVLIRGYGWDEQAMLKKKMPDIPILVGEDRVKAAHRSIKLYGTEIAILDDGFQYWELGRDLDIVLIDSRNPFGNGALFPRGILREPKSAIARAGLVVFTKVDKKTIDIEKTKEELKRINKGLVFLEAIHRPKYFYDAKARKDVSLSSVKSKRVILLSSIGDGRYFEDTMKDLGGVIVEHIAFGDHHNYRSEDRARIMRRCDERSFDFIITTEKDAVKLNRMSIYFGSYTLMTLVVEMEITDGREKLIDRLHSLHNG